MTHASAPSQQALEREAPLSIFSQCHAGITRQLEAFGALPQLVEAAQRARALAAATLALFDDAVLEHHLEEEKDLFPAVLRSAAAGDEREHAAAMVQRLTSEHRALEALWQRLAPAVREAAHGRAAQVDAALVQELVGGYLQHARFEEQAFLPLAETVLRRDGNHIAALGLALHLRHVPQPAGHV